MSLAEVSTCHLALCEQGSGTGRLIIAPPVSGLVPPLGDRLRNFAIGCLPSFSEVHVVEFSGQNGRPGRFSLAGSRDELASYLDASTAQPTAMLGLCSGAAACFSAAHGRRFVTSVAGWEASPRYQPDQEQRRFYERRFGVNGCDVRLFEAIDVRALVESLHCPVMFAFGNRSNYVSGADQFALARAAAKGFVAQVHGLDHFLGGQAGRGQLLDLLSTWWASALVGHR